MVKSASSAASLATGRCRLLVGFVTCVALSLFADGSGRVLASGGGGDAHGGGAEGEGPLIVRRLIQESLPKDISDALVRGDDKVTKGDFASALKSYQTALDLGAAKQPALLARMGFCAEQLGDHNRALAAYRDAMNPADIPLASFASLGQARVWAATDNLPMALELTSQLALGPRNDSEAARKVTQEAQLFAAFLRARLAIQGEEGDILAERGLVTPSAPVDVEQVWQLLKDCEQGLQTLAAKPGEEVKLVQQTTDGLDGHYVAGSLVDISASQAFEHLVGLAQRELRIAPRARQVLLERSITQAVSEDRLDRILTNLCDRFGVVWLEETGAVVVMDPDELPLEQLKAYRLVNARKGVDDFIRARANHPATNYLRLLSGNLSFHAGDFHEATDKYQSLSKNTQQRTVCGAAKFNLAKTKLSQHDRKRAMEQFYETIDSGVSELTAPAYLYVGRLHLEDNRLPEAMQALHRSMANASGPAQKRQITLCLANAQLLSENAFAAAQLLQEQQGLFANTRQELAYAFTLELAHVLGSSGQKQRFALKQLATLRGYTHPSDFFGSTGYRLLTLAHDKLELLDDWNELVLAALEDPNLVGSRGIFLRQLAEIHRRSGDTAGAANYLHAALESGDAQWTRQLRLELVELTLDAGQLEACEAQCIAILREEDDLKQRRKVLHALGKIYEKRGDRKQAIRCFAGIAPEAANPSLPKQGSQDELTLDHST